MSSPEPKKIKFTDDNIEYYERQFKLEHDRAMGYVPRSTPPVPSIMRLAMEVFRPSLCSTDHGNIPNMD